MSCIHDVFPSLEGDKSARTSDKQLIRNPSHSEAERDNGNGLMLRANYNSFEFFKCTTALNYHYCNYSD